MKPAFAATAVLAMFALAACDDPQKAAQAPQQPPAQAEPAPPADSGKSATETAKEGLGKLREAAEKAVNDLQPTIDKAKDATQQALKDAQPTIDKAKEAAKQLGLSIDEIVKKGQEDLNNAAQALEKRLREAGQLPPAQNANPDTALSSPDKLRADTRAAARASQAGIGPAYVGVWVAQASDCAKVDQQAIELMAVITPTTVRRYESVCNIPETELTDGKATVEAQCIGEGDAETRQITFTMPSPDKLSIATSLPGETPAGAAELLRCNLPQ
jgi:gas vesicle protein